MPSSDYSNAVGGGLKLKGAKDAGVKKKKSKRPKLSQSEAPDKQLEDHTALQEALAEEEKDGAGAVSGEREAEVKQYGKTEAQKRHEERRRKRVCVPHMLCLP